MLGLDGIPHIIEYKQDGDFSPKTNKTVYGGKSPNSHKFSFDKNGVKMLEQKGKLIKIESNHNLLRTDEIVGSWPFFPEVGSGFVIYSEPLDKEGNTVRYVRTSKVQEIEQLYDKIWEFKTQNSTYRLEIE